LACSEAEIGLGNIVAAIRLGDIVAKPLGEVIGIR
jgi:hypothetical protein